MVVHRPKGAGITAREINDPRGLVQRGRAYRGYGATKLTFRTMDDLDQRTQVAIDAANWYDDVIKDLGGQSQVSVAKRTLLKRAAFIKSMCEHMEYLSQDGAKIDMKDYAHQSQVLANLLKLVGLERVLRDVTPNLKRWLADREAAPVVEGLDGEVEVDRGMVERGTVHSRETQNEHPETTDAEIIDCNVDEAAGPA